MKKAASLIFVLSLLLVAAQFGFANEVKSDSGNNSKATNTIPVNTYEILFKLSHTVDFWHDANLKGDLKKVKFYREQLFSIITDDIRLNSISDYQLKPTQAENSETVKDVNPADSDKKLVQKYTPAKKLLLRSLRKSQSFSYQYRLLNDYLELLRKEQTANKTNLAKTDEK